MSDETNPVSAETPAEHEQALALPAVDISQPPVVPAEDESTCASQVSESDPADIAQIAPNTANEAILVDPVELPTPPPELVAQMALAEQMQANCLLRSQLDLALDSLDKARDELATAKDGLKAELLALVDVQLDWLAQYRQRVAAVEVLPASNRVRVFLRRPAIVGGEMKGHGETLAQVTLAPGVTLNYLVDAVRDGIAKGD